MHDAKVPVVSNRPTYLILAVVIIVILLAAVYFFLQREGKARSNPTDGHTQLRSLTSVTPA